MKATTDINVQKYNEFYQFVFWNCLPQVEKDKRGLSTQKDFGQRYGIHEATLCDWKKRDEFWKVVEKEIRSWAKDLTPNVVRALYKRAVKTNNAHPKDTELWFKFVEGWDVKNNSETDSTEQTFSTDDLNSIIQWLPEDDQRKFYAMLLELTAKAKEIYEKHNSENAVTDSWLEPQNFI